MQQTSSNTVGRLSTGLNNTSNKAQVSRSLKSQLLKKQPPTTTSQSALCVPQHGRTVSAV